MRSLNELPALTLFTLSYEQKFVIMVKTVMFNLRHMSGISEPASEMSPEVAAEPDVELLLASANAIQRLVAERKALLERVEALENELRFLRQRTTLVHDSYRQLTNEFVAQFKLIDTAVSNLFKESAAAATEQLSQQTPDSDRPSAAA
jgi:hypothetical protein